MLTADKTACIPRTKAGSPPRAGRTRCRTHSPGSPPGTTSCRRPRFHRLTERFSSFNMAPPDAASLRKKHRGGNWGQGAWRQRLLVLWLVRIWKGAILQVHHGRCSSFEFPAQKSARGKHLISFSAPEHMMWTQSSSVHTFTLDTHFSKKS